MKLRHDIDDGLEDDIREEIEEDLREEIEAELRDDIETDIRTELEERLTAEITRRVEKQIRAELTRQITTEVTAKITAKLGAAQPSVEPEPEAAPEPTEPKRKRSRRGGRRKKRTEPRDESVEVPAEPPAEPVVEPAAEPAAEPWAKLTEEEPRERVEAAPPKSEGRPRRKRAAREKAVPAPPIPEEPVPEEPVPEEPVPEELAFEPREARKRRPAKPEVEPVAETPPKDERGTPTKDPSGPFGDMLLTPLMRQSLIAADYLEPTPIQSGLIPLVLEGVDVIGQARTGTGKTAAFGIPLIEKIKIQPRGKGPVAIVLVPTRELAVQVRDECAKLAERHRTRIVAVYGGKPIRQQIERLHRGTEIVVGTPGRVLDLLSRRAMSFAGVRYVVLDEADRMLDIGFRPDIEKILRQCPASRQTLLLSATMPPPVVRLAKRYMRDPQQLNFSPTDITVDTIEQHYFTVDPKLKFDLLVELLKREDPRQAIVFCRTKRGTDKVHLRLSRIMKNVATIHGDLPQTTRDRVMRQFREGKIQILVATDVIGRGIDVTSISHIINYDIPQFCDDYIHRVGRAGRMGREGVAYTFVSPEEGPELTRIEMRINLLLKRDEIEGFVACLTPTPARTEPRSETGEDGPTDEAAEAEKSKPVFGKSSKRYRRAL